MAIDLNNSKPPYVRFDWKDVEDRAASLKEGRYMSKSVAYAYITSPGSKDEIEKDAKEWLTGMRQQSQTKQYLAQWHDHFAKVFDMWEKGHEIPEDGTPIRTCPIFKPNEVKAILEANVRTLEDLDTANEETLIRIGIGSRSLQSRAREYISAAKNIGASAEQVAALTARLDAMEQSMKDKDARIAELMAQITTPKENGAHAPRETIRLRQREQVQ